jgi:hypothetical protein
LKRIGDVLQNGIFICPSTCRLRAWTPRRPVVRLGHARQQLVQLGFDAFPISPRHGSLCILVLPGGRLPQIARAFQKRPICQLIIYFRADLAVIAPQAAG